MSQSNRVKLIAIPETVHGKTPVAGDFFAFRYTSESLSGSPTVVQSQQIRTDRMSSGQVAVGLEVGGSFEFELSKEAPFEEFAESAMNSTWATLAAIPVPDATVSVTGVITSTDVNVEFDEMGLAVGDFVKISGFTAPNADNNGLAIVKAITTSTLTVIPRDGYKYTVPAAEGPITITRADKLTIGTSAKTFSIEKIFEDLTTKAINYKGMVVNEMNIEAAHGALMTGSFGFLGTDHATAATTGAMISHGRTVTAQPTTDTMNGSIDMPIVVNSATGELLGGEMCIQNMGINLNNNNTALVCIGKAAPEDHSAGEATVGVSLSTYLKDSSWHLLPKKLTQESFAVGYAVIKDGKGYGVYLPAIQVTSDDPASGGGNQEVSLDFEGVGKVGDNGESALTLYRID